MGKLLLSGNPEFPLNYPALGLNIPDDFGIKSSDPSPFSLAQVAQVAQPQRPVGGQYIILSQRATHF
jgi:hypothetical protein